MAPPARTGRALIVSQESRQRSPSPARKEETTDELKKKQLQQEQHLKDLEKRLKADASEKLKAEKKLVKEIQLTKTKAKTLDRKVQTLENAITRIVKLEDMNRQKRTQLNQKIDEVLRRAEQSKLDINLQLQSARNAVAEVRATLAYLEQARSLAAGGLVLPELIKAGMSIDAGTGTSLVDEDERLSQRDATEDLEDESAAPILAMETSLRKSLIMLERAVTGTNFDINFLDPDESTATKAQLLPCQDTHHETLLKQIPDLEASRQTLQEELRGLYSSNKAVQDSKQLESDVKHLQESNEELRHHLQRAELTLQEFRYQAAEMESNLKSSNQMLKEFTKLDLHRKLQEAEETIEELKEELEDAEHNLKVYSSREQALSDKYADLEKEIRRSKLVQSQRQEEHEELVDELKSQLKAAEQRLGRQKEELAVARESQFSIELASTQAGLELGAVAIEDDSRLNLLNKGFAIASAALRRPYLSEVDNAPSEIFVQSVFLPDSASTTVHTFSSRSSPESHRSQNVGPPVNMTGTFDDGHAEEAQPNRQQLPLPDVVLLQRTSESRAGWVDSSEGLERRLQLTELQTWASNPSVSSTTWPFYDDRGCVTELSTSKYQNQMNLTQTPDAVSVILHNDHSGQTDTSNRSHPCLEPAGTSPNENLVAQLSPEQKESTDQNLLVSEPLASYLLQTPQPTKGYLSYSPSAVFAPSEPFAFAAVQISELQKRSCHEYSYKELPSPGCVDLTSPRSCGYICLSKPRLSPSAKR